MCQTADRYTFMVLQEILEEARCDMNKVRVHSDVEGFASDSGD